MDGDSSNPGAPHSGEGSFGEAVRVSPDIVGIAIPLLLTLFPERDVLENPVGRLVAVHVSPPLEQQESKRLLGFLYELVDRPEWRRRHAVAREVSDARGTRIEVVLPLAPGEYDGGEALVGPFDSVEAAKSWASQVAQPELAFDTMLTTGGHLADLFLLGELLDD